MGGVATYRKPDKITISNLQVFRTKNMVNLLWNGKVYVTFLIFISETIIMKKHTHSNF